MKRILPLILLLSVFFLAPMTVHAEEEVISSGLEELEGETKEGILSILPDAAKPLLPNPTDEDAAIEALGFKSLFALLASTLADAGGRLGGRMLALFALSLFFGTVSLFVKGAASLFMQSAAALSIFSL